MITNHRFIHAFQVGQVCDEFGWVWDCSQLLPRQVVSSHSTCHTLLKQSFQRPDAEAGLQPDAVWSGDTVRLRIAREAKSRESGGVNEFVVLGLCCPRPQTDTQDGAKDLIWRDLRVSLSYVEPEPIEGE